MEVGGLFFGRVIASESLPSYSKVLAMHADGMSYNEIAQHFREIQAPTARCGRWAAAIDRCFVLRETAKCLAA